MKNLKLFIFTCVLFFGLSPASNADLAALKARVPELVKAKDAGLIGELPDGLVGVVAPSKASNAVKALVNAENEDRKEIYEARSKKSKQELSIFMKVMGEARIKREKSGRFYKDSSGNWQKK